MVKLMVSEMGEGKTKRLIKLANETSEQSAGNVVYIDDDNSRMYDLKHDIRFVSMSDFPIKTHQQFLGFLYGIISNDYDIDHIFIDGFFKVTDSKADDLPLFVKELTEVANRHDIRFVMTASSNDIPDNLDITLID